MARAGGKHSDLDDVGRTNRHFSFFEMLGNFSFGDYFKAEVIPWAWELVTAGLRARSRADLGHGARHRRRGRAASGPTSVGMPAERIQRLGDADNFWRMGDTGPCGPSSEIFFDLGPEFGPGGGPAESEDRYLEIWNLVFMQFDAQPDGELLPLPKPSIDTGAGLERNLGRAAGRGVGVGDRSAPPARRRPPAASPAPTYGGVPRQRATTCRCGSSPTTAAR